MQETSYNQVESDAYMWKSAPCR